MVKDNKNSNLATNQAADQEGVLPKTGIEQIFMKHKPNFLRGTKEFEPINEGALYNKNLIEDYKLKEITRGSQT